MRLRLDSNFMLEHWRSATAPLANNMYNSAEVVVSSRGGISSTSWINDSAVL
jgi:hypothetical protein